MTTQAALIRRQYDEVIARHYDRDPQGVAGGAIELALAQLATGGIAGAPSSRDDDEALAVLDVGIGTGRFLRRLRARTARRLAPYGIDPSAAMIEIAAANVPDLVAEIGDGASLDTLYPGRRFDVVATHFVTGYVPIAELAPRVARKLSPSGHWSFVGGTLRGFPGLRALAESSLFRLVLKTGGRRLDDHLMNPQDTEEVVQVMEANGFDVRAVATLRPPVSFPDLERFLEFAYHGGWLAPLIEAIGLHRPSRLVRAVLDRHVFPREDHHDIAVVLARRRDD